MLRLFQSGVSEIGLPVRVRYGFVIFPPFIPFKENNLNYVRCDNGAENVGVVQFMAINRSQITDKILIQPAGTQSRFKNMWATVLRKLLTKIIDSFKLVIFCLFHFFKCTLNKFYT